MGYHKDLGYVLLEILDFYWDHFDPNITAISIAENK